ncbi:Meiotically up-regulated protein [Lachnellula hyalina]|uniref:Meiotically up-regulated protein n=1 Tax=Lachnellula hyalina TaxID=1316788 RepID=A0A8H8R0Z4_9HELO|nr:Meiotically up-regulated protein [Lachnellula hyalina]TVY25425.1 Meiotically up-regulated protein [Lachnellula hyalina]
MHLSAFRPWMLLGVLTAATADQDDWQSFLTEGKAKDYARACPDYKKYSTFVHQPLSDGPMSLPFQRPAILCRTFNSPLVEKVIEDITGKMVDKDLARLFENAFPNTLDTTVRWHVDGTSKHTELKARGPKDEGKWEGPHSFVVTGDINAEWLRDSTNQLLQYQPLAKKDQQIFNLILGAINTQSEYVIESPYCNAFQPPPGSKLPPSQNGQDDNVHPAYEPSVVFECKYELDSLAHFLALGNTFYKHTGSLAFLTPRWYKALDTVLAVIDQQSQSTFDPKTGRFEKNSYTFNRKTDAGTETLSLGGVGNPLNYGTGLVRSAFRPSDDATILGFYIPANAQMAVELKRASEVLKKANKLALSQTLEKRATAITDGIWEHGVIQHKKYGRVFAYEVDGYGSQILMDDANVPSLLALPILGFVDKDHQVYKNTRKMLLEKSGNPYYLQGHAFHGIGGPHIGLEYAWPMSLLLQAMTSDDDKEIKECIELVLRASKLGLVHESINVNRILDYTRSWFAWANSVFAQTILDLAKRKPHLLFGEGAEPYIIE